jgi:hypothetical protein
MSGLERGEGGRCAVKGPTSMADLEVRPKIRGKSTRNREICPATGVKIGDTVSQYQLWPGVVGRLTPYMEILIRDEERLSCPSKISLS